MRVVVAGAGVAGLTAAVAFTRAGHDVAVVEERRDAGAGAGISLWPNALAALDEVGLGDAVRARSARITGGAMRLADGTWIRRPPAGAMEAIGEPLAVIERPVLRDVLSAALPPDTVRSGVRAMSARDRDGITEVVTADGDRLGADLVVAADGTGSRLAREFNDGLRDSYAGYTAWRGIADIAIDPALAGEVFGSGVQFGAVPLPDGRTYWFATQRLPERTELGDDLAHVAGLAEGWPDPVEDVVAATPPGTLLRNDLYDRPTAKAWSRGRVVLVGDAAHPMRPHLGQGGCQAIEDAVVLASALARTDDVESALVGYQRVRIGRVRRIVWESRLIGLAVNSRPPFIGHTGLRLSRVLSDATVMSHLRTIVGADAFRYPLARL